jgi:hydrogenase small subunit
MFYPSSHPWMEGETLAEHLEKHGVSRRDFLAYCAEVTAILGLSSALTPRVVEALQQAKRPSVVWLQLQECTGCVESTIRTGEPTIGDLVLDLISLDYNHTLMAAAGSAAEAALHQAEEQNRGQYILIVTGSVPLNEGGIYTTIGGRTAREILVEGAAGAAAVIAVGACAHWGNIQASRPNPTGAVGVTGVVKDKPVVNIAGCPPIADVITATIVHYLTFNRLPALDRDGRPMFAYGKRIHDQCPRRAHFDAGQYVETFDDEAARKGWCLYRMGCKGPASFSPCPIIQWNQTTSWPIGAGHPCLGCTERNFWDVMTPFYGRLPDIKGFGVERRVTAGIAAHAVATGIHRARQRRELPVVEQGSKEGSHGQD